jgi:hypothetical protein
MTQERKINPKSIVYAVSFIFAIQLLSLYITYENIPVYVASGYSYAPAGTSSQGSFINVLFLVGTVFVATLVLGWLLRKRRTNTFRFLIFVSLAFSSFFLTLITADSILSKFNFYSSRLFILEIAISITPVALIALIVFGRYTGKLGTAVLGLLSAEVGSFFASTLPPLTAIILPAAFAIYDVYAVFKGPLKQLISAAPGSALAGVSVKVSEFTIGLGDNVFYAMLPSLALFYSKWVIAIATMVAIDIGVWITLSLLARRKVLPGLPIPVFLGLFVILLFRIP